MSPLVALQTAKVNPDLAFRGEVRRIAMMQPADLAPLKENPQENIQSLDNIAGVYTRGQWLDQSALQTVKDAAKASLGEKSDISN